MDFFFFPRKNADRQAGKSQPAREIHNHNGLASKLQWAKSPWPTTISTRTSPRNPPSNKKKKRKEKEFVSHVLLQVLSEKWICVVLTDVQFMLLYKGINRQLSARKRAKCSKGPNAQRVSTTVQLLLAVANDTINLNWSLLNNPN